jgi:tetratricopeptide (TPR) repeat protein
MQPDATSLNLVVLSVKQTAARCRVLETQERITLRSSGVWDVVPGEIVTVQPRKRWTYAKHPYLSGEITASRIDMPALGLTPLRLQDCGVWDPREQYWGEEGEPLPEYAQRMIERGPRREYEMEQILPGDDPKDPDWDPIIQSNDLKDQGDFAGARTILMRLLEADLRCLDAHAHLGNLIFDLRAEDAMKHYGIGMRIGELSLGAGFGGVLSWGWIDNRPFLRCMHGYGLCLWRLGRTSEAAAVFERMLWLNPSDNQGERFNLHWIREGRAWADTVE